MQQFLQQVGIELKINQLEYANFETEVYENKNFDMYLDWQGFGVDPDIASRWLTSTAEGGTIWPTHPTTRTRRSTRRSRRQPSP